MSKSILSVNKTLSLTSTAPTNSVRKAGNTANTPPILKTAFANAFRQVIETKSDILMSIMPVHMCNIASGKKNHEYRKYRLPANIKRIWFYTSHPTSSIQYVAQISSARTPGEVPNDGGIGNDDFNAGKKVSKYGYHIQKLWRLNTPITLQLGKQRGYLKSPPQKYQYATAAMLRDFDLQQEKEIINRTQSHSTKRPRPNENEEQPREAKTARINGNTD